MDTNVSHLNPIHEIYASVLRKCVDLEGGGGYSTCAQLMLKGGGFRLNDSDTTAGYFTKNTVT